MKKKIVASILFGILIIILTGCHCKHEWQSATYSAPKTCIKCGEIEGLSVADENLVGTWKASAIQSNGKYFLEEDLKSEISLSCLEDHTARLIIEDHITDITWQFSEVNDGDLYYEATFEAASRTFALMRGGKKPLLIFPIDKEHVLFMGRE